MVGDDLIRRLSLEHKRRDDTILFTPFMTRHVDPGAGINELFAVHPVGVYGIVSVLARDRAPADRLRAPIADIWCLIQTVAALPDKAGAVLVTDSTGTALNATENDLVAYVGLLAVVSMDTKIMCIIKRALAIQVVCSVESDLLGDRSGILTKVFGDLLERQAFIQ